MTRSRTPTEIVALSLLTQDGIAAIWQLHLSAALAYRDGQKATAAGIIEIADAAEREWLGTLAGLKQPDPGAFLTSLAPVAGGPTASAARLSGQRQASRLPPAG